MSRFDEEPDADLHGECAYEIRTLQAKVTLCESLVKKMMDRPSEWVESEESMRGAPLREVLRRNDVTIIWHHKKPETSNPVWEVIGQG